MSNTQEDAKTVDPVLALLEDAPLVEATAEELAAFEEGLAEIKAGKSVPAEHVRALLNERADKTG